ncbi:hypothetical protein [Nocardioides sp. YIM 152588]|uniref:hypothetical protein n=1 Tax=Nocardioides sp. YIM 152588 TaxID=3158259 RepID=UPI0032E3F4DD
MLLHVTRPGVVAPVAVDPTGLTGPTRKQARGPRWRGTSANRFVPAGVDPTGLEQRIVEAIAGAPDGAAVTGWAALAWNGGRWFTGTTATGAPMPVPIAIDDHRTLVRVPGALACHDWLFDGEVTTVDGIPITVPERSLSFALRRALSDRSAIELIDMAYFDDLTSPELFGRHLARLRSRPGVRRARRAFGRADENAWSPMESVMRCLWEEAGLDLPLTNPPVFDRDGKHLLTPDLLDPTAGVAGEYYGAVHAGLGPRRRDLVREDLYRDTGIELVPMMSTDMRDTGQFVRRLHRAYGRASARGADPDRRTWTLEQPDWWVDTSTVERRRALSAYERATWLRHRS